ncbi:hypothetical protein ACIBQ1_55740 [Nonomuraea sp. NPDC050153]|uniref:hypothetical protein n=1 Tax=Nonomuraea sp. NPDC050153 TaxID=3364359 RepID=UPI00379E11CE
MTTPGDPNEPRPGQDPSEGRREEEEPGRHTPEWWRDGESEEERREPAQEGEEPIAPAPPVVPRPDVPPTHEPRPGGEPTHPDLPTSPETPPPTEGDAGRPQAPPPTGGDAEETQVIPPTRGDTGETQVMPPARGDAEETQAYPIPGATPPYPGWGGAQGEPPARPAPSRYEQGDRPPYLAPDEGAPDDGGTYRGTSPQEPAVPGTTPSSPYGGPPGYGPPPYGAPYQRAQPGSGLATASLVLGVASPFLVFVCFTGLITAILSIVFGCVALAKRVGKGRAVAGIVISGLSLVLFAIVAIWFWRVVQECAPLPSPLADKCFQDKFPWMGGRR